MPTRADIEWFKQHFAHRINAAIAGTPFSLDFMVALACLNMGLTVEEAITAATLNAAVTIGRDDTAGSLQVGKSADLLVLEIPNYLHLAYRPAANHVGTVIKNGEVVVRERRLEYEEDPSGSEAIS